MYTIADDSSSIGIGNHRRSSFLGTSVIWSRMMGQTSRAGSQEKGPSFWIW
ncbi:hypothetical protein Hanom_Chr11g01043171 [Helianthus anomalus]